MRKNSGHKKVMEMPITVPAVEARELRLHNVVRFRPLGMGIGSLVQLKK